jgi:hypothetical protein
MIFYSAAAGLIIVKAGDDLLGLGIPVGALTPAGLLAVMIILIAMGRLVPRRTMEDVIHDRNEWRAAHRLSESARIEQDETLKGVLHSLESVEAFIRAIPTAAEHAREHPDGE